MIVGPIQHASERPRVAVLHFSEDEAEQISGFAGEFRRAGDWASYGKHWAHSETDLIAIWNPQVLVLREIPVLDVFAFGDGQMTGYPSAPPAWWSNSSTERELVGHSDAANGNFSAAIDQLIAAYATEPPPTVRAAGLTNCPLVTTATGQLVAGILEMDLDANGAKRSVLVAPERINLRLWFGSWLSYLAPTRRSILPNPPGRMSSPTQWSTPRERVLLARIADLGDTVVKAQLEVQATRDELALAREQADEDERQLLWADGDELVDVVRRALSDLGFDVVDVDATRDPGDPKAEDLYVTDSDVPDWCAIAEVKGYAKGPRTNDLSQIRTHKERFRDRENRWPDATWWIVNPSRGIDPSNRPTLNKDVEKACQLAGVAAISSTELYRIWIDVLLGELEAVEARRQLRSTEPGLFGST